MDQLYHAVLVVGGLRRGGGGRAPQSRMVVGGAAQADTPAAFRAGTATECGRGRGEVQGGIETARSAVGRDEISDGGATVAIEGEEVVDRRKALSCRRGRLAERR